MERADRASSSVAWALLACSCGPRRLATELDPRRDIVRRAILVLAAAALTACGSSHPTRSVVVYWEFLRHTQTGAGNVAYDQDVNVGGGDATCSASGVEVVQITD